jgi:hypothetical protein
MAIAPEDWEKARQTVRMTVKSSLQCAIASRNPDGSPHLTPIGSVFLTPEVGKGFYIDMFNRQLAANVAEDPKVTIMAVDSGRLMWLRSLLGGSFVRPPGVRLVAEVGAPRPSTPEEVRQFQRFVGPMLRTRGGQLLWGRLGTVRDLRIDSIVPLRIGPMTESHESARIGATVADRPS